MQRRHPSKEQHMTPTELQRLKEEAARANSAYDAARKAYKAQQKAQARTQRLANASEADSLPVLLAG